MEWLGYIGIATLVLGLLYLFAPGFLRVLDEWGKEIFVTVEQTIKYHIWIGLLFVISSAAMIYIGFVLVK